MPWIPLAVFAAGTAASAYQADQARKAADTQMDFQRSLSNTAYQRAVADMKAAGLNPMLAYSQGGASTPSGAQPQQFFNPAAGVAPAVSTAVDMANMRKTAQDTKTSAAQEASATATARKVNADAASQEQENLAKFPWLKNRAEYETRAMWGDAIKKEFGGNVLFYDDANGEVKARPDLLEAARKGMLTETQLKTLDLYLRSLGKPEAEAYANYFRSWWGSHSMYGADIAKGISSAAELLKLYRGGGPVGAQLPRRGIPARPQAEDVNQ